MAALGQSCQLSHSGLPAANVCIRHVPCVACGLRMTRYRDTNLEPYYMRLTQEDYLSPH